MATLAVAQVPFTTMFVLGLAYGAIFAVMGLGIALVYKTARVINFAQGEIGTLSAFVAWWLIARQGTPWVVGAAGALAVACAIGYLMHRFVALPMREAPRMSLTIATLGVAFLLLGVELKVFSSSPEVLPAPFTVVSVGQFHFEGVRMGYFLLTPTYILALAVAGLAAAVLGVVLTRTRFGIGVLASAQDAVTARLLGIPSNRVSAFTWIAAAMLGAVAGLLIAPTQGIFYAFQMSGFLFFRGLVAALVGGMDSLTGVLLGAVFVGEVNSFSGFLFQGNSGVPELVLLGIVLVVMLARPRGLLGSTAAA